MDFRQIYSEKEKEYIEMQGKHAERQIKKMLKQGYKIFQEQDFGAFHTIDFYRKFDFDYSDHKLMFVYPDGTWKMN